MNVSCHGNALSGCIPDGGEDPRASAPVVTVALVGNANVGKSVVFNQLTGLNQYIGNWPGKTVSWAEGECTFHGLRFKLVDLPGIYSLSTYSLEEIVTRDYITKNKPDFIVNVIDASNLERNLFLTIQLLMLSPCPVIVVANQWDVARSKGLVIDSARLGDLLSCPVIEAVAVHGRGTHEILEWIEAHRECRADHHISFGKEVESRLDQLSQRAGGIHALPGSRFTLLKLLEGDSSISEAVGKLDKELVAMAKHHAQELEKMHGEDITSILSAEIYFYVNKIVNQVQKVERGKVKASFSEKLDHVTTHSAFGYLVLAGILLVIYFGVFTIGSIISDNVDALYDLLTGLLPGGWESDIWLSILWSGGVGSLFGAIGGVLPFIFLFYLFMEVLQDSGYLPRAAFLMDGLMHRMGLHGKSIIPLIISFGCNVPGCTACKIMETHEEKKLNMFVSTMVPCAAVTTVVLGLVGTYVGILYAALLYAINFAIILVLGRLAFKMIKGANSEMIIELHDFRKPNFGVILKQTWFRGKEFLSKALLLIVIIGMGLEIMLMLDILDPINAFLSPVTVFWLGLPAGVGIFLIYGVLRKELTLVLLATFVASIGMDITLYMTPLQMMVFALVTMLYVPCFTTIIVLGKECGWKYALIVTLAEIGVALLVGGVVNWIGLGIVAAL